MDRGRIKGGKYTEGRVFKNSPKEDVALEATRNSNQIPTWFDL